MSINSYDTDAEIYLAAREVRYVPGIDVTPGAKFLLHLAAKNSEFYALEYTLSEHSLSDDDPNNVRASFMIRGMSYRNIVVRASGLVVLDFIVPQHTEGRDVEELTEGFVEVPIQEVVKEVCTCEPLR